MSFWNRVKQKELALSGETWLIAPEFYRTIEWELWGKGNKEKTINMDGRRFL